MTGITFDGDQLSIGSTIVDALLASAGKGLACVGRVRVGKVERRYRSRLSIDATDKALRLAAGREGKRVTFISSQAVES